MSCDTNAEVIACVQDTVTVLVDQIRALASDEDPRISAGEQFVEVTEIGGVVADSG